MAVPGLGCKGHDFEANQAGGHQLDRNDFYPPTAADLECQSTFGASFCGIAPVEAGHDSARCHEGNAMEIRDFTSFSRGKRASRPYPETRRERDHSAHPGSHQPYGPSAVTFGSGPVATAEGMIQWIRQTKLRSTGATCYLNSGVTAQPWTLAMMADTVHEV